MVIVSLRLALAPTIVTGAITLGVMFNKLLRAFGRVEGSYAIFSKKLGLLLVEFISSVWINDLKEFESQLKANTSTDTVDEINY